MFQKIKEIITPQMQYDIVKQNQDHPEIGQSEQSTEIPEKKNDKKAQVIEQQIVSPRANEVLNFKLHAHSLYGNSKSSNEINIVLLNQQLFNGNKSQNQLEPKKSSHIKINAPMLFTVTKEFAKHPQSTFTELFGIKPTRYILLQDQSILILDHVKEEDFKVKSVYQMRLLYKIFFNGNEIILCFYNQQLQKNKQPKQKRYILSDAKDQKVRIMITLRTLLLKIGLDYEIIQ